MAARPFAVRRHLVVATQSRVTDADLIGTFGGSPTLLFELLPAFALRDIGRPRPRWRSGGHRLVPFCMRRSTRPAGRPSRRVRRPGRLRRSPSGHRRRRMQGALLGRGSAAQRRRVRAGVSGRDDGGVLRRTQRRVPLLRRRAAWHRLRQHHAGGGEDSRGRHAAANAELQRAPLALLVRRSLRTAGEGQRQVSGFILRAFLYLRYKLWVPPPVA